jgi:serine/threonine-protein kinase
MSGDSDDLDKLIERVADGQSVDWDELERAAPDEDSRRIVRQLRLIAEVGEVYRSRVDEDASAGDADVTVSAQPLANISTPGYEGARTVLPAAGGGGVPGGVGPPGAGLIPAGESTWGHLLLVRKIGEGSFGEVFHAHDTWLDHPVALKLLKREAEARVPASQLLHEARKLARVRHPNVVTVHGADRHNGRVGFWMDYIDGETLASRVSKGRLSPGEAVSVGQEVCRALAAVHQANLIHRDIKAQNVMRAADGGRIILMDFGAGEFIGDPGVRPQGTPLYLAPELLRGEGATVRSDIYAVGVLLYHLVTGRFPVDGPSPAALIEAHERGDRKRLRDERADLPDSFISIVERAIDPDPERRYGSAGAMEAKLSGEPATRPISVAARPSESPIGDYVKRAAAGVAALVILAGVLGFIAASATRSRSGRGPYLRS